MSGLQEVARWTNSWRASPAQARAIADRLLAAGHLGALLSAAGALELPDGPFADYVRALEARRG